jgi:hypothetical protein
MVDQLRDSGLPETIFRTQFESAEAIAEILMQMGINIPSSMLDAIKRDALSNEGNVVRIWREDGSIASDFALPGATGKDEILLNRQKVAPQK